MNLNVAIIDDHPLVLEGLKSLLSHSPGITSIHTAQTGSQLKDLMGQFDFQLYIIDLDLPDIDGFILIHQIKQKDPTAKIVVSTMHEEIWIVNKLKNPDIDAVVFKSSAGKYIEKPYRLSSRGKHTIVRNSKNSIKKKKRSAIRPTHLILPPPFGNWMC